jgi:lipopolysaccharide heptosyltransferase II
LKPLELEHVRRVLVLNRNNIGDCLLTTPLLRALKRRFPAARISVAIPEARRDLLATNPHVDEIIVRPKRSSWWEKFGFAFKIRSTHYDLIVSLQEKSLFYSWATCYAALARRSSTATVALRHPRTRRYYQHCVDVIPDRHEVYKYLDVAEKLGCPRDANPVLELEPTAEARQRVDRFISTRGIDSDVRFIAINPGGTKQEKRWAEERFAQVADRLHRELGLPVMVLGGPEDIGKANTIAAAMKEHEPLVTAGHATLNDTAALLERCQLLVTGDTGPMHMAVALAVPVVALFGPTNPSKYGPFTRLKTVLRHDRPCSRCSEPCIHTISADQVVDAALRLYSVPPRPESVRQARREPR